MDGGIISYEEAIGASPTPSSSAPMSPPVGASPPIRFVGAQDAPSIPLPLASPGPATPVQTQTPTPPAAAVATPPSNVISYEDAVTPDTPNPGGALSNASDDSWLSGAAKGIGTAAVKAVGNTAGFVGGLGNFADYLVARGEHAVTGQPVDAILADMAKAKQDQEAHAASTFGIPAWTDPRNVLPTPAAVTAPILKQTGEYKPTSWQGQLAQAGAEAVLSSAGPGAGAKAGTYADIARGAVAMAPANFAAGAAAQGAVNLTGDPLAGAAAGTLAPIALHAGLAGVSRVAAPAIAAIPESTPILGSIVQQGVENAAARKLIGNASDPVAAQQAITNFDPNSAEVPGTIPTTAAVANDPGLLQAEMTARGTGGSNVEFNDRDAVQNNARVAALNSTQPQGDVFRPGQFITQNLEAVDAAAQRAQDQLEAAHAQAVAARAQGNQAATDRLTQSFQAAHDQLHQAAQSAAAPLGEPVNAEDIGATLRAAQQEATNAAKQIHNGLYDAVDPNGTLTVVASQLKAAKAAIQKSIDLYAGVQPKGAEAKLWRDIDRLPDVIPFRSLQKLDSRVTAAMSGARRKPDPKDPEAITRLTELKSAVMAAINDGAENQVAHEAQLVQAGLIAPEDTVRSRFADWIDTHYARQADASIARVAGGGGGLDGATRGGPIGFVGGHREAGQGRVGFTGPASDQGISQAPRVGSEQPEVTGGIAYQAPALGDRTVSAQMHAPEIQGALGHDVSGTVVRPFSGPLDRSTNLPQGIVAYHGTPYDFDRFDISRVGSGDGRQVQGAGLNFTDNKRLAEGYAQSTLRRGAANPNHGPLNIGGRIVPASFENPEYVAADALLTAKGDTAKAAARLRSGMASDIPETQEAARLLDNWGGKTVERPTPHVLQVRIAKPPATFLEWNEPFSRQSKFVQDRLSKAGLAPEAGHDPTGQEIYQTVAGQPEDLADIHNANADVSKQLDAAGISGVAYTDSHKNYALARPEDGYDGSRNFVTFNDRDIHVTHRNGVPLARPAVLPDYLKGEARGAFVKELSQAGMSPVSFSPDLKKRAEKLFANGNRLDHGSVLQDAAIARMPKEDQDAVDGGAKSQSGTTAARAGQTGTAERDGPGDAGQGLRQSRQAGGASSENRSLKLNFTPEVSERLTAAKAAYAAYAQTFENPIVKGALETNGYVGQYNSTNGSIPSKWIVKGDKGFETANAFLAASSNDPRAISAMQDALLNPLRKGAMTNGTIHPNALARWKDGDAYGPALRAMDQVSPGFSSRFDTAAHATQAVLDAGIEHAEQLREFQRQAAAEALTANAASKATMNAGLAGVRDQLNAAKNSPAGKFAQVAGKAIAPTEVENTVGNMLKTGTGGAARMRDLVQSVSADPDALEGLRKAGVDWIVRTHLGATEAGSSGEKQLKAAKLISFIGDNRDVLKELFTNAQISMMGAVSRSIETDAKWVAATTAKNGPGTAKDLAPKISESTKDAAKHGSMIMAAMEGLDKGMEIGGLKGAGVSAAVPAAYLVSVLRHAGMKRIDDVYTSMMLDPEIAKVMLSKMPETMENSKWHSLTRVVRRGLINGPLAQEIERQLPKHK